MKRSIFFIIFSLILFSCKENVIKVEQPTSNTSIISNGFILNGTLENFYPKKVFLNKIIENSIYPIDSSNVSDNNFTFKGFVEFPERFALTFENYSAMTIVIVENTKFEVFIRSDEINDPLTKGSQLNSKLYKYKTNTKNIFKKIEYLFPQFQKARLENNVEKLNEIELSMKKIETEFTDFSFNYIIQNKESYLAMMILRDQLKSSTIDTLRIKKTYQILSEDVKNSPDAEIISSFLNLH